MKMRSQRGAARISAVWMIVVVVLFFVALAFGYIANEDKVKAEAAREVAVAAANKASTERDGAAEALLNVTKPLGFHDRDNISATSDPALAAEGLDQLRSTFPNVGADIEDFERAIPVLISSYSTRLTEINTLQSRITDLEAQVKTAQEATRNVAQTKDAEIQTLTQEKNDLDNTSRDEKSALQQTVDERTASRNQADSELRAARGTIDDKDREAELAAQAAQTRAANLTEQLKFKKEPEAADGNILEVSKQLGIAWISRGSQDKIARGMKFAVRSGNPAAPREKGEVEVINVKEEMSEVKVTGLRDAFDPIVAGDTIYNPVYDPTGTRFAVLVGRFDGTYNEAELRILLTDIGIEVQHKVDLTTTYLIVGSELYVDEDGEPVEDAIQPSELQVYKDAVDIGAKVISINEVRSFFKK